MGGKLRAVTKKIPMFFSQIMGGLRIKPGNSGKLRDYGRLWLKGA